MIALKVNLSPLHQGLHCHASGGDCRSVLQSASPSCQVRAMAASMDANELARMGPPIHGMEHCAVQCGAFQEVSFFSASASSLSVSFQSSAAMPMS